MRERFWAELAVEQRTAGPDRDGVELQDQTQPGGLNRPAPSTWVSSLLSTRG